MAEKLRLIIARIPWSLLLKAGVFWVAWQYGPRWIAVAVALLAYLFPIFPLKETGAFFVVFTGLALALPVSGISGIILTVALFLILGNRELLFLARNRVSETVILLFVFLASFEFFGALFYRDTAFSFGQLAFGAIGLFLMLRALFRRESGLRAEAIFVHPSFNAALITFLFIEFVGVIALVPMNVFYKTAFALLGATVGIDLALQYIETKRDPKNLFLPLALFFIVTAFMLISNTWQP